MNHDAQTNPDGPYRLITDAAIETLREGQTAIIHSLEHTDRKVDRVEAAVARLERRSALTSKHITAAAGGIAAIVTAVSVVIQAWGGATAKAEAKSQAAITTELTYNKSVAADRERSIADAVAAQAKRDDAVWSARVEAARVKAERQASMRVPLTQDETRP